MYFEKKLCYIDYPPPFADEDQKNCSKYFRKKNGNRKFTNVDFCFEPKAWKGEAIQYG